MHEMQTNAMDVPGVCQSVTWLNLFRCANMAELIEVRLRWRLVGTEGTKGWVPVSHLDVLRTHRRTVGDRAFAAAGPTLWNSLPHDVTDCVSLTSICRKLKTFCFLYHFHDYIFFSFVVLEVFTGHFISYVEAGPKKPAHFHLLDVKLI